MAVAEARPNGAGWSEVACKQQDLLTAAMQREGRLRWAAELVAGNPSAENMERLREVLRGG